MKVFVFNVIKYQVVKFVNIIIDLDVLYAKLVLFYKMVNVISQNHVNLH